MAIHLIKVNKDAEFFEDTKAYHMEFGMDAASDVSSLPAYNTEYDNYGKPALWSMAIDGATGDLYYLKSTGWTKVGA